MLREMARSRGFHPSGPDWWDNKDGMKFLSERKSNPRFDQEVDDRLIQYIKNGGVVITSYTVPWLYKGGLKLWFSASQKTRAKRLAGRDKVGIQKAIKVIKSRDARNTRLYKKIYNIAFGKDLSVFNYIIDTEDMKAEEVAVAAAALVKEHLDSLNQRK